MNPTAVFLVSLVSLTITFEGLLAIWEVTQRRFFCHAEERGGLGSEIGSNGACQACPGGLVPVSPSECGAGTTTAIATTVVDTVEEPLTPR